MRRSRFAIGTLAGLGSERSLCVSGKERADDQSRDPEWQQRAEMPRVEHSSGAGFRDVGAGCKWLRRTGLFAAGFVLQKSCFHVRRAAGKLRLKTPEFCCRAVHTAAEMGFVAAIHGESTAIVAES